MSTCCFRLRALYLLLIVGAVLLSSILFASPGLRITYFSRDTQDASDLLSTFPGIPDAHINATLSNQSSLSLNNFTQNQSLEEITLVKVPRLAAFILVDPQSQPGDAVRSFVQNYVGFPYDFFVLYETMTQAITNLNTIVPNAHFVDVSSHFQPELSLGIKATSCDSHIGYKLMCRFMSGPVYWLPELASYEQTVRIDDDSGFTSPIIRSIELQGNETYGYTLIQGDSPYCQIGFPEFLQLHYSNSPDVVRWGPVGYASPWVRNPSFTVYNCNFEVASLALFRSTHYRDFWARLERSRLFFLTRLGDHEVKTMYVETFEIAENVVCYDGLPYTHPGDGGAHCHGGIARSFLGLRE
jgi:hypothetical protein